LGLTFHFVGKLFTSLGALNEWQPVLSAVAMPLFFLLLATWMLWLTERR
jgi:lipopolysaccharide export system permease protein